jgi:hypothetical protein
MNFLTRRVAAGNRISSLKLGYHPPMDEDVAEVIRFAVGFFEGYERGVWSDEESSDDSDDGY